MLSTGNVRTARRARSRASRPLRDRMRRGGLAVASSRGQRQEVAMYFAGEGIVTEHCLG